MKKSLVDLIEIRSLGKGWDYAYSKNDSLSDEKAVYRPINNSF